MVVAVVVVSAEERREGTKSQLNEFRKGGWWGARKGAGKSIGEGKAGRPKPIRGAAQQALSELVHCDSRGSRRLINALQNVCTAGCHVAPLLLFTQHCFEKRRSDSLKKRER